MSDDIAVQLRAWNYDFDDGELMADLAEAADHIDRLRAELVAARQLADLLAAALQNYVGIDYRGPKPWKDSDLAALEAWRSRPEVDEP